jgi:hypothetical protein
MKKIHALYLILVAAAAVIIAAIFDIRVSATHNIMLIIAMALVGTGSLLQILKLSRKGKI